MDNMTMFIWKGLLVTTITRLCSSPQYQSVLRLSLIDFGFPSRNNRFDNPTIDYLLSTKQQTKQLADEPNEWILDLLYVQVQTEDKANFRGGMIAYKANRNLWWTAN